MNFVGMLLVGLGLIGVFGLLFYASNEMVKSSKKIIKDVLDDKKEDEQ